LHPVWAFQSNTLVFCSKRLSCSSGANHPIANHCPPTSLAGQSEFMMRFNQLVSV
jgi:hypothetical protein